MRRSVTIWLLPPLAVLTVGLVWVILLLTGPRGADPAADRVLARDVKQATVSNYRVRATHARIAQNAVMLAVRDLGICSQRRHSYAGCHRAVIRDQPPSRVEVLWTAQVSFAVRAQSASATTFTYSLSSRGNVERYCEPPSTPGCSPGRSWVEP